MRSALLFKLLCTRQFSFRNSFARINKWRKGTILQQNNNSAHESRFARNPTSAFLSLFLNVDTVLQNSSRHRRCSTTTATAAKRSPVNRTRACVFVCLFFKLPFDYSNSLNISNTGVFWQTAARFRTRKEEKSSSFVCVLRKTLSQRISRGSRTVTATRRRNVLKSVVHVQSCFVHVPKSVIHVKSCSFAN